MWIWPIIIVLALFVLWVLISLLMGNPIRVVRRRLFGTFLLEHLQALARLRLPIARSLGTVASRLPRASQRYLRNVEKNLNEGLLVGDAIACINRPPNNLHERLDDLLRKLQPVPLPRLVSPAEAEVLRIGEMSGDLERALGIVLKERRRFAELRNWLFGALLYPAAVMIVLGGLLAGVLTYIVPKFKAMFQEMDVELPVMTQLLLDVADVVKRGWYGVIFLIALLALILLRRFGLVRPLVRGRRRVSDWVRRGVYLVPFAYGAMRRALLAEFCRELGMLLRVGTPAPRALRVIAEGTLNPWFRDRVRRTAELCEGGVALGDALDRARLDYRAGWFARAAGTAGDLAGGLYELGEDYAARVSWTVSVAARLIPPLLILGVGLILAWSVVALLMPLLSLMNSMGG